MEWLAAKDKRVMAHLYDQYSAAMYGLILRMVQSETAAQDILQEVFLKVWKYGDKYDRSKGTLFTWLIRITRNTTINTIQSKSYKMQLKQDAINYDTIHANGNGTLIRHLNVNKIGLKGLVTQLEEKYRIIIDLVYFQGFTQNEVVEHLGIPLGTVKSRVRIGLRELRKKFDHTALTILMTVIHFFS